MSDTSHAKRMMKTSSAEGALGEVWTQIMPPAEPLVPVTFTGPEDILPSIYAVTTAAATATGAATAAAARLLQLRNGWADPPEVSIDRRHAGIAFRGERYLRIGGRPAAGLWEPLSGNYRTADDRWLLLHANLPPHRAAALAVLGVPPERDAVAAGIRAWNGVAFEDALAAAGGCCAVMRTAEEWTQHPQARAIATLPTLELQRIGDAPPAPLASADRPAAGIRVLDLTRVIAGPVSTRTLAAHGADVLRIGAAHLTDAETLIIETGFGKRSANLDLRTTEGLDTLRTLVEDADVVVQGYRPGTLAAKGLSPEALAEIRPGLVYVSLCAYGRAGPWAGRRGFDSLVQMASGIAAEGARAAGVDEPRPLPAQALDHASGYLGAFGALAGLIRQRQEGGSWLVQLSLAQTGAWLTGLGSPGSASLPDPQPGDVSDLLTQTDSPFGRLEYILPVGQIASAPPHWDRPPGLLGSDAPAWT